MSFLSKLFGGNKENKNQTEKKNQLEISTSTQEDDNLKPRSKTFSYSPDNPKKQIADHLQHKLENEKEYDRIKKTIMEKEEQESEAPSTVKQKDMTNTQSQKSNTTTTTNSSMDPLHQSTTSDHPEAIDHTTQNTSHQVSSSKLEVHSRSTNTDPPFNYYTPFLTLGGLVIVALIVYALIKFYYTSITKNQTQERETKDSQNTTSDTLLASVDTKCIRIKSTDRLASDTSVASVDTADIKVESTDRLDFSSNKTRTTTRSSPGFLFESTADIESTEMTEEKLMPNHTFHANDTIKILTSFYTDTRNCRPLPKGMRLRVVQVDSKGDLKVRHNSWKSNSWIFENNYYKIQKI